MLHNIINWITTHWVISLFILFFVVAVLDSMQGSDDVLREIERDCR